MQIAQRQIRFSKQDVQKIKQRFEQYSEDGLMSLPLFKKSMGLLGVGQAQYLSDRMFALMTNKSESTFQQFLIFLDTINNGSTEEKAKLSFRYLNRQNDGQISYDDIQIVVGQISFLWLFLTGQKISSTLSIELLCEKLGITEDRNINFKQYLLKYDKCFNWYDFFNSSYKPEIQQKQYSSLRTANNEFKVDQVQQYLKLVHSQIESLLFQIQEQQNSSTQSRGLTKARGPMAISSQQFQPRGQKQFYFRQTLPYLSQQQLSRELTNQGDNIYEVLAGKLSQLSQIASNLFTGRQIQPNRQRVDRHSFNFSEQKKAVLNMTKPKQKLQNFLYFGHQNWNLMLNMMLGVRRSLKSHYYKFAPVVKFTQQDIHCKYYHQLLYKVNQKSIKQVSYVFVDYAPKVFHYIRKMFGIDNTQFLRSIGLQNLVGNLLMGNLSTLSDLTSQGKSGSFMYYTSDAKIIVKSTTRQQYLKLRQILEDYAQYVRNNPETYLVRIYGLYKMKNKQSGKEIYFMVMANVFDSQCEIDQRYDIKGATHNRRTLNQGEQVINHLIFNKHIALKDVDLINNKERTFDIESSRKQKVFRQIIQDASFLKNHNIIEYSLLIGIHNGQPKSTKEPPSVFDKKGISNREIVSKNHKQVYFFGIIDILSEYSAKRVLENKFFSIFSYDISCRDPQQYFVRFKQFIHKYVFTQK